MYHIPCMKLTVESVEGEQIFFMSSVCFVLFGSDARFLRSVHNHLRSFEKIGFGGSQTIIDHIFARELRTDASVRFWGSKGITDHEMLLLSLHIDSTTTRIDWMRFSAEIMKIDQRKYFSNGTRSESAGDFPLIRFGEK